MKKKGGGIVGSIWSEVGKQRPENLQEGREKIIGEEFQQECPRGGTCNRGSTGETEQVETWAWVERLIFLSRSICPYTGCSAAPTMDTNHLRINLSIEPNLSVISL